MLFLVAKNDTPASTIFDANHEREKGESKDEPRVQLLGATAWRGKAKMTTLIQK